MAQISLFRIDFRLIHGQVITKWIKQIKVDRIVIVDDLLSQDDLMMDVYRMAAPPGIKVEIFGNEAAVAGWKENELGAGDLLVLVRDVKTALYLKQNGFGVTDVMVGGLGGGSNRITVIPAIAMDQSDADGLKKLGEIGCNVYLHVVPNERRMELDKALERFNSLKK
jgi:D-glucosaminate-specific PTS system IIB component